MIRVLSLKFKNKKKSLLVLIGFWLVCICLSTYGYYDKWGALPIIEDLIWGHLGYGVVSLPMVFAGVFSFFDLMALALMILFWPMLIFFQYQIVFNRSVLFFVLLFLILLPVSYYWLISSISIRGV